MDDAPPPFDAIYAHAAFVRAMAIGVLGGDPEVEDVVQETWLVAMRSAPRSTGSLRSWLGGVSRRLALRTRRSAARRESKHGRGARPEGTPSVTELAAREEVRGRLVRAVLALEEPYRAAILLRYVEDLPVRVVAGRLGVPLETARTRLRRGLERLRERLDAEHGGERRAWASALVPFAAPPTAVVAPLPGLLTAAVAAFAAFGALAAWLGWGPFAGEPDRPDLLAKMRANAEEWRAGLRPSEPEAPALAGRPSTGRSEITGVVRRGWEPVAGARVEVRTPRTEIPIRSEESALLHAGLSPWLASRTVGVSTTDSEGRYRVRGIPARTCQVVAFAPDGRLGTAAAEVRVDGVHACVDLEVTPHRESLSGRIAHADGTPWVGLVVAHRADVASWAFLLPPDAGPVRTDDAGRFRLAGLDPGAYVLVAVEPGVEAIFDAPRRVPAPGEIAWTVPWTGSERTLRVLADEDGSPIAGAEVLWAIPSDTGEFLGGLRRALSDREGQASVPVASMDSLWITAPGYLPLQLSRERAGEAPVAEVRLARGARIAGRVTRVDGTPVRGARVRFDEVDDSGSRSAPQAVTDERGRYELVDVAPREGVVKVVGEDVYSREAFLDPKGDAELTVTAPRVGETRTRDLVALPGTRVEGRVTDALGKPAAGALVVVSPPEPARASRTRAMDVAAATDASGGFAVVAPWPAAGSRVTTVSEDEARGQATATTTADGAARADVVLGAPQRGRAEVHVVAEGGDLPVAGARVSIRGAPPEAPEDGWGAEGVTDAAGIARLTRLPEGPLLVRATSPEAGGKVKPGTAALPPAGEAPAVVRIEVPLRLFLEGETTQEGKSVGGVHVHLRPADRSGGTAVERDVVSDAQGRFRFEELPYGAFEVSAERGVGADLRRGVVVRRAGDADFDVELSPVSAPTLSRAPVVRIVGPDGAPVPAGWIVEYRALQMPGAPRFRFGSAGSFRAGRAQRGEPEVTSYFEACAAETASGTPLPFGAVLAGPFEPGSGEIVLRMPVESTIEGRVVDPDGLPVEGVLLRAWPTGRVVKDDGPSGREQPSDRTGADGAFRLRQLGAFRYRVTVLPPPRFALENVVELESGVRDATVRLRAGVSPTLLVLDPDGKPAPGVDVAATIPRLYRTGGREIPVTGAPSARATTNAQGTVRLLGLDPVARYTLGVGDPMRKLAALPFVRPEWAPVDTTVRLERSYRIAGVVRDREGRPLHPATVSWLSQPPNGWTGDRNKEDGTFEFSGLPAGATRLMVMLGDVGEYGGPSSEFPARAGDEHLELVVDAGLTLEVRIADWPPSVAFGNAWLWRPGDDRGASRGTPILPGGVATFHRVQPGSDFEFVIHALADGRTLHLEGVHPDAGRVEARLVQGGVVEGRLVLPPGATQPSVWAGGTHVNRIARGTVGDDGRFVIRGVPPGRWWIQAAAQLPGEVDGRLRFASGAAEAAAGETVEIVLRAP